VQNVQVIEHLPPAAAALNRSGPHPRRLVGSAAGAYRARMTDADHADAYVAAIRRLYDALAARDVEAIASVFADDVEVYQTPELPWGGTFRGHDGVLTFFLTIVEHIDSKVVHDVIYAAGDHVVQRGRTQGTVKANGAPFDIAETHLYELREHHGDVSVVRFESYIDTPAMLAALNA
jgi:ketosteroid isomerase-like protein